jgi:tRNA-modifying protein YgfZ
LAGVSFTKGCFVGQEVVSRMQHRGTARSRILPVTLSENAPASGTEVRAGEMAIGTILSSDGRDALALLRLDRLKDAVEDGRPLLTEGGSIHAKRPPWAKFEVATAAAQVE